MLKIVICEDDIFLRDVLVESVNKTISDNKLNASIVFESGNYDEMFLFNCNNEADLYILDINLCEKDENKNGVELGVIIREKYKDAYILFLTGINVDTRKLFEMRAYNYIMKPLNLEYVNDQILKIYNEFIEKNNKTVSILNIYCSTIKKTYRVKCTTIMYAVKIKNNDTCMIHLSNGRVINTNMTLEYINDICNKLIRTHKSFLCNVQYIDNINYKNCKITMQNGEIVELGGTYINNFRKIVGESS